VLFIYEKNRQYAGSKGGLGGVFKYLN